VLLALGRAWILFESRKNSKPRVREMLDAKRPSIQYMLCWALDELKDSLPEKRYLSIFFI
jgi:hypothetical protein